MSWISRIARADIVALQAYEHAAWEPGLERLHANESPWPSLAAETGAGLNRYPEPQPRVLLERLAQLYGVTAGRILVGRGSDEAIDVLTRGFCRAGQDAVIICPPTFGMYAIAARIQGARVLSAPLQGVDFALDAEAVLDRWTPEVKLIFLCSPNNPTGNLLSEARVLQLARALTEKALVVVDEAYLEFSCGISLARHLEQLPNLAILRTLSKAHALAGARCGALLAHPEVIALLRKVIPPLRNRAVVARGRDQRSRPHSFGRKRGPHRAHPRRARADVRRIAGAQRYRTCVGEPGELPVGALRGPGQRAEPGTRGAAADPRCRGIPWTEPMPENHHRYP